jgi:hypothetical protein
MTIERIRSGSMPSPKHVVVVAASGGDLAEIDTRGVARLLGNTVSRL